MRDGWRWLEVGGREMEIERWMKVIVGREGEGVGGRKRLRRQSSGRDGGSGKSGCGK